jgi:hypothetical protein
MARLLARSLLIVGCCVSFLGMLATVPASTAQTNAAQLETKFIIPNSNGAKYPSVATFEDQVYVAANPDERAVVWSKQDAASAFADQTELGFARGKEDYTSPDVAIGSDGSIYVAWADEQAIFLRNRAANSPTWGDTITVRRGGFLSTGADDLSLGVASDGKIFIIWRETDRPFRYIVSSDGGAIWSSPSNMTDFIGYNSLTSIATGPNGSVLVAITVIEGGSIQVYAAVWNGSGFDYSRVSWPGTSMADTTATISGNGNFYVAWRGDNPAGVYYAARQPDGTWPLSQLADMKVEGIVAISADAQDNLHMFWAGIPGPDRTEMTYAFKSAGGEWQKPIGVAPESGENYFNAQGASTLSTRAFGHGAVEQFTGRVLRNRYFLFSGGPGTGVLGTEPKIEGDQAIVGGKTTLSVNFENVAGNPTQIRWNWGAPPTDANNDSNGWQPFSNPLTAPAPSGLNPKQCHELTLHTQVRNSNATETKTKSDAVTLDLGIQGSYRTINPHTNDKSSAFTPMASPN